MAAGEDVRRGYGVVIMGTWTVGYGLFGLLGLDWIIEGSWKGGKVAFLCSAFPGRLALCGISICVGVGGSFLSTCIIRIEDVGPT